LPRIGALFDGVVTDTIPSSQLFTHPGRCLAAIADIGVLLLEVRALREAP